jgi:hypothetical protein
MLIFVFKGAIFHIENPWNINRLLNYIAGLKFATLMIYKHPMVSNTHSITALGAAKFKGRPSKSFLFNGCKQLSLVLLSFSLLFSCTQNQDTTSAASGDQTTQSSNELVAVGTGSRRANTPIVVPSDSLIVPGVGMGNIKLDAEAAPIMKKLGKPDAGDAAMGKAVATWFEQHDKRRHVLSIFTAKDMGNSPVAKVKQIRVTAPAFKTVQGISASSPLIEIQKAFNVKKEKSYQIKQQQIAVYADPSGIAFEVDEDGRCIGIVVYPKGDLHADTYARLVPGSISGN